MNRLGSVRRDISPVSQPCQPSLHDVRCIEWNDPEGDVSLALGEVEQARARQDLHIDMRVRLRIVGYDR